MTTGRRAARRVVRSLVALVSTAVLVATGYGWSLYNQVSTGLVTSDALGERAPVGLDEPFTALLVGLDSRTDENGDPLPPDVLAELRAGEDEGQLNTDTIILLHVPAGADARASAISIPRDSFVQIAGGLGVHKINSAYRRGMEQAREDGAVGERAAREAGRRTLVTTVERLTGIAVDHYAEINLAAFVEITRALGGVPVCLNAPVREQRSGVDLPAGPQVVSGGDALAFVRQRHDLPDGDLDRVTRQQAFLAGLAGTVMDSLSNPARIQRLVGVVTRYVVLDRGWELDRLVEQLRRTGGDLEFRTIPTGRPDLQTPVDGVAVEVDPPEVRRFVGSVTGVVRELLTAPLPETTPSATPTPTATATATTSTTAGSTPSSPPVTTERPITAATVPCVD